MSGLPSRLSGLAQRRGRPSGASAMAGTNRAPRRISDRTVVTGSGSTVTAGTRLLIGATSVAIGTVTIADGGMVTAGTRTSIGAGSTLNLGTGGLAGDGEGTGLSIVRALVKDELQGRLQISSDPNTRAEVVFPA